MVIGGDMLTQLEMGTRTLDFPQVKLCPELQALKALKMLLRCRAVSAPWVGLGLVTSQLSPVKSGAVWVNKRGLTFGRFPGEELESKNKIKST